MIRFRMGWTGVIGTAALCVASVAIAATDPAIGGPPAAAAVAAPRPATAPKKSAATVTARRSTLPAKPAAPGAKGRTPPRTLDPVHIEGELDVPEVLFITARDQRRIVGFQHARYLPGSRDIARSTPLPSHVVVDRRTPPTAPEGAK